jgi:hypothetical protein
MCDRSTGLPDWRDGEAYRELRGLRAPGLAWEWLRRDSRYRSEALEALAQTTVGPAEEAAAAWGLHRFEDPRLPAPLARPIWRADHYPLVLVADARTRAGDEDRFELERHDQIATHFRSASGSEHLLLSESFLDIRIDIVSGTLGKGPVELAYRLSGLRSAEAQAAAGVLQDRPVPAATPPTPDADAPLPPGAPGPRRHRGWRRPARNRRDAGQQRGRLAPMEDRHAHCSLPGPAAGPQSAPHAARRLSGAPPAAAVSCAPASATGVIRRQEEFGSTFRI